MWKLREIYSHAFWQKFRESKGFTKEITKELISRKKHFSEREFLVFPHCDNQTLIDWHYEINSHIFPWASIPTEREKLDVNLK